MDEHVKRRLQMALATRAGELRFVTADPLQALMTSVMDDDPRLIWFLESYRYERRGREYRVFFSYKNKSTKTEQVQRAQDAAQCLQYMCRAAATHARTLLLAVPATLDYKAIGELFHRKHTAAYPNLTAFQTTVHAFMGAYCILEIGFTYRVGSVHLAVWEKECAKEVKRVAKMLFSPDMPPEAKVYLAHNYLALTVQYDRYGDASTMFTAYGALCLKKSVCQGIAEAFLRLMEEAGVECRMVTGTIHGTNESHAWNLVKLGGGYCHVDATWDSAQGRVDYGYFCVGDDALISQRAFDPSLYPTCTAQKGAADAARRYIRAHKWELLRRGADARIPDC